MKKALFALLVPFFLSGCLEFSGQFTANEDLEFLKRKRRNVETVSLPAGTYRADLEVERRRLTLKIRGKNKKQIQFHVPRDAEIPEHSGDFFLTAEDVQQNYGISGNIDTTIEDGPTRRDNEFCTYYVRERRCYPDGKGGHRCEWRDVPVNGWRDVEFFLRTTTKTLLAELTDPVTDQVPGSFSGQNISRKKIYTWRGRCWGGRHPYP